MSTILDDAALAELLASSGTHGEYDEALQKFLDSGEKGINVSLESGPFAGKKPTSVKSGFVNALNRRGKRKGDGTFVREPLPDGVMVAVISKNDKIYVIRRDLVVPQAATSAPAATPAAPAAPAAATA